MTDLSPSEQMIQVEETGYRGPVSENFASRVGGSTNACLINILPVGSYCPTSLTEAQFQAEVRGTHWVLADGRSANGTRWKTITGRSNIPDARGVVLRGKDHSRGLNPDGDLSLDAYQGDQFAIHGHSLSANRGIMGSSGFRGAGNDGDRYSSSDVSLSLGNSGGNETRGKSVTVNWMFRVN